MNEKALAAHLRSVRTLTQADVDRTAQAHEPKARYAEHDRHIPAAH